MAREMFIEKKFRPDSLDIIEKANIIIEEYANQGFNLTLRQLYYQFVARALIPNKQKEYKRLGYIVSDARMAGLIDWNAIVDRTREVVVPSTWDSPKDILATCGRQYQEDLWASQEYRPEVWIEKEALVGVFEGVCAEERVPYFACRGYASQTLAYEAGKRFAGYHSVGVKPVVLHFGDHDPSGLDMTRDNGERLTMFANWGIEVRRLALNMDQIDEYNPPPNPAKETDSRFEKYRNEYGDESWELDALDPNVLSQLVIDNIAEFRNQKTWDAALASEVSNRRRLRETAQRWDEVSKYLDGENNDTL